jgi:uncharacterized membrane protein
MRQLLSGIIACGAFVAALHFLQSWRRYTVRLIGFILILVAIIDKNRVRRE